MYNEEESRWFNYRIFYHRDKKFNSNSSLDISLTTSTKDFKSFSNLSLNFSITRDDGFRKSCILNYQDIFDLVRSFKEVKGKVDDIYREGKYEIFRQLNKVGLKIGFKKSTANDERAVIIALIASESEFNLVILPYSLFLSLDTLLNSYLVHYIGNGLLMTTSFLSLASLEEQKAIVRKLTSLPSSIMEMNEHEETKQDTIENEGAAPITDEVEEVSKDAESQIADLEKFLGEDMGNISLGNLDKAAEDAPIQKVDSLFVEAVLKSDISSIEALMSSIVVKPSPIEAFAEVIEEYFPKESYKPLPGISEKELKSAAYFSGVFFNTILQNYLSKGATIPSISPVVQYAVPKENIHTLNMELSYDLLLISGYVRILRSRIESKVGDATANKSILSFSLRCFTDIFTFSYLEEKEGETIKNCLVSRFKYFQDQGFFKSFEEVLDNYGFSPIAVSDIESFAEEVSKKVLGQAVNINDLHDSSFQKGVLRIPSNNNLSLEQITNEVVPFESALKSGTELDPEKISSFSKEVVDIFEKGKKLRDKINKPAGSSLFRFVNWAKEDVPEKYREEFSKLIEELGEKRFNFSDNKFPLEEFGEQVVKALYIWDPEKNEKHRSYKDFQAEVQSWTQTKEQIMTQIKTPKEEGEGWIDEISLEF